MTMSSLEDCKAVLENLDGKVRDSLSFTLYMCLWVMQVLYICIIDSKMTE